MIRITAFIIRVAASLSAALGLAWAVPAQAADYPAKPLTFVVPFGAGSATDLLARALSASLTQQTGQDRKSVV